METILKHIDELNKRNYELLKFDVIRKKDECAVITKTIVKNLYKYSFNLIEDKEYFKRNCDFIKENILNKKLNTKDFEKSYILLFEKFFDDNNIWYRTRIKRNMSAKNKYGKTGQVYSEYNVILKELGVLFNNFEKKDEHFIGRLYDLFITLLSKIHPFSDNNFWTISLLVDLLLLKNNYLPIWIKWVFKANKIFLPTKQDFYKIIEARYKKYSY